MKIIELERLYNDTQKQGGRAILDRCFDKQFCDVFGFDMKDKYLYSRIEQMLSVYVTQKTLKDDKDHES